MTDEVLDQIPEIERISVGMLHLFIQHTSASLTINENASPAVRGDMERHFNEMVPENQPYYEHTLEGSDDMPAHIKASLLDPYLDGRWRMEGGGWRMEGGEWRMENGGWGKAHPRWLPTIRAVPNPSPQYPVTNDQCPMTNNPCPTRPARG